MWTDLNGSLRGSSFQKMLLDRIAKKVGSALEAKRLAQAPFYRRYPYVGRVSHRMVDLRGMVGVDHGFFFNRIPKSANSTVARTLALACGIPPKKDDPEANWAKEAFPRPSELTTAQMEAFEKGFKFTFVRDPYARVLSAYLDKVKTGVKMTTIATFAEFCRYLAEGGLHANAHWAPQSSLLLLPIERFDFIGRVENIKEDLSRVFAHLSLRPSEPRLAGPPETNARDLVGKEYTDECRETVRRLYRRDFEFFGYPD
jgi:hypothetical protein